MALLSVSCISLIWSNSKYPNILISHIEQYIQHIRDVILMNKYSKSFDILLLMSVK